MKPMQQLYRGSDNKKVKPSKVEKVYNLVQKEKKQAAALKSKKETAE